MADRQQLAADSANGSVDVDGARYPAVTRDQALQLVEYWMDQSDRNMVEPVEWYEPAVRALGYERPGDKFRSDRLFKSAFANALLPSKFTPMVWEMVDAMAEANDGAGDKKPPRIFAMSAGVRSRWQRIARKAWGVMKRKRAALNAMTKAADDFYPTPTPIPRKPPKLPPPLDKPVLPRNPFRGLSGLLILIGAVVVFSKEER